MSAGADPQIRAGDDKSRRVRPKLTLVRSDGRSRSWEFCACGELGIVTIGGKPYCPAHFITKVKDITRRVGDQDAGRG